MRARQKRWLSLSEVLSDQQGSQWKKKLNRYALWTRWNDIVGPTIARHVWPASWRAHTLIVNASNHAWIQELQFMRTELLAKIREAFPSLVVDGIRFELGTEADKPKDGAAAGNTPFESQPLSPDEIMFAREALRPITDDETRSVIRRLIEKDLSLKKTRKRT